ncbi:MAG TPA: TonB-dependent receptor [Saprospiraceae bacterium]|nr:TonB-dependent receptor [Saprospiraceae bacterium]
MKKPFLQALFTVMLLAGAIYASGQRTVSGTVTSTSDNTPLIGATIVVRGTSTGTVTDVDGNFSVEVNEGDVLVISYTGYQTQEVTTAGLSMINVGLVQGAVLSEVVVTGYTAQRKRDLTGAVGVVNAEALTEIPSGDINGQLQGRVSGVTVSGEGRPGASSKVRIRGFTSFTGANDPLYVVDGVPTFDISNLNPTDVESISVLKDAGAASIYGSRAANGVILITTKKGQYSGVRINYDMYVGTQNPGEGDDRLLNTQQYADLQWLVYRNDETNETHPIYGPSSNSAPTLPPWAADTDWWDVLTRNALVTGHDLSFSGGNESARFYAAVNYLDQEGIVIHNFAKRLSARVNTEFKFARNRVTLGESLIIAGRSGNGVNGNGAESSPVSMGIYRAQPIIPHIIESSISGLAHDFMPGDYGGTGIAARLGNGSNQFASQERDQFDRQKDTRVLGSAYLDIELMKGLNARSTFGGTYQNGFNTDWASATYENAENVATSAYTETGFYNADWVWTNTLTLNKKFGRSNILVVGGYEALRYGIGRGVQATKAGYFSDDPAFRTVSNGAQITAASSWYNTETTLASIFARADYSYNNRYYLSATARRDGSSRFSEGFRYATFPSVSAGVRVSDFFEAGFISDLKVRGGYGTMGNQQSINPANQFYLFGGDPGSSNYDIIGAGSSSQQGFRPTRIGNADTKWETQTTTNIGFDAGLFNSALQLSFDWYQKSAEELLVIVPLSDLYGSASAPARNIGEIKNTGIDLQLDYRTNFTPDLGFNATVTFTTYNNEIVKYTDSLDFFYSQFGDTRIGNFNRNEVGHSVSEFYGYQVLGLFQNQAEVDAAATQDGAEAGFFRYQDTDGDGEITPEDRVLFGNPNPDFTFGLNLGLDFRNFSLSTFFYGSQGNDIFNYNKWWTDFWPSFQGQKSIDLLENSWTSSNTGASVPKASNKSNFSTNTQSTSYYVEDGSFIRLKSLQLGYSLPESLCENIGLTDLKIYVQGTNLFTLTDYSGLDPDIADYSGTDQALQGQADTAFGVDLGNYPLVKQFLVGLHVGF